MNTHRRISRPNRTTVTTAIALLIPAVALSVQPTPVEAADSPPRARYAADTVRLTPLGTISTGTFNNGASEIVAFHPATKRGFVVNAATGTVDVIDWSNPESPERVQQLPAAGANSVAVHGDRLAVAQENVESKQAPGTIALYSATSLQLLRTFPAGALPDMTTFSPDGRYLLSANEGEPSGYGEGQVDPEGSITVVDLDAGVRRATVRTATLSHLNGREDRLRQRGVRIFGPGATAAQDLEPEYIAVHSNSRWASVSLQENNAIASVNLRTAKITSVRPLGLKDHSLAHNALDANDRDGVAVQRPHAVKGMYQPDAIASFTASGKNYLVTANEGDARDYDGFSEESRASSLTLNPSLPADAVPGRLNVTTTSPSGQDGYSELWAFGARSVSIRTPDGALIWDSGNQLETLVAERDPQNFNANHDANPSLDNRSDNKGPEPEGVTVGVVKGRTYAFVGLERVSAIVIYDVTDPRRPQLAGYASNRGSGAAETPAAGDLGPEGLAFVAASDSPTGQPLLLVGNEVSGTTTAWEVSSLR